MLVTFSIVPMMIVMTFSLFANISQIEELHKDRLNTLAHTSASALKAITKLYKDEVSLLSTNSSIRNFLHENEKYIVNSQKIHNAREELTTYVHEYINSSLTFEDFVLLDEKGTVVAGYYPKTIGLSLSKNDYYVRVLENKDPDYVFFSKVHESLMFPNDPKKKCLAISKVLRTADNQVQGIVVAFVDTDTVAGFFKGIEFGKTGLSFITDSDNFILYHKEPRFFNSYTAAPKIMNLIPRYKAGEIPDTGLIDDVMGNVRRIYYYTVMDELVLFLRQDYSEYTTDRDNSIKLAVISTLLTISLALFLGIRFSRNFTTPILQLKEAFASGDEEGKFVVCDLQNNDELGDMARNYNKMIQTLEKQFVIINDEKMKNEYIALHDNITGMYNRNAFEQKIAQLLESESVFSVFFIDLDSFKQVNDIFGHPVGDELLKAVGKRFLNCKAEFDICARIGGDEFLLAKVGTLEQMKSATHYLLEELQTPFKLGDNTFFVTASVGIASYPENGDSVELLIKNADIAMYQAKDNGKNMICFFNDEMHSTIERHNKILQILRDCIENEEVFLMYQPEYNTISKKVVAIESLMRIQNQSIGFIGPGEFIPIAESDDVIINKLGAWALQTSCSFAKELVEQHGFDGKISVNISFAQLRRTEFVDDVIQILEATGLKGEHLQLEITESILMTDMDNNSRKLSLLREQGVTIAIDDFGTNYSSFNYLVNLPLDFLKIDMSFSRDIEKDERKRFVTKTIIELAQNLELQVVAEGVETQEQYELYKDFKCDIIQGYYFNKPLKREDIISKLTEM